MGKKGDLSNFERGMVISASSISQSAQLLGFSHTTISRVYKGWFERRKCMVEVRGEWTDWFKLIEEQL